jgi:hypothetical protein
MSEGASDKEVPLYGSDIDKALQKPSMAMYVPVFKVLLPEIFILMLLFILIKFWVVIFLPLHLILVIKTNENIFWVDDMITNFFEVIMGGSTGMKGKKVMSFQARSSIQEKRDNTL